MHTKRFACGMLILSAIIWGAVGAKTHAGPILNATEVISTSSELTIPTSSGAMRAIRFDLTAKILSETPQPICVLYVPQLGRAWTGNPQFESTQAVVEDRFIGFEYWSGQGNEHLRLSVSTNRYQADQKDPTAIVQTELERYKAGRGKYGGDPCYVVRIEKLLGSAVIRDRSWPDTNALSLLTRPSNLKSVSVEQTNAVVAIEIGTNILAKIAFDSSMRPVWATTNDVFIGPIPTNTVRYIGVKPDGHREIKVVY